MRAVLLVSLVLPTALLMGEDGLVPLPLKLPRAVFKGTPAETPPGAKLEPGAKEIRPPFMVAKGLVNLASEKPVTGSEREPVVGELKLVTDGDKEGMMGSYVELGEGRQWVQVDLGSPQEIHAIVFWLYHGKAIIFHDVIVQVSDDVDFITDVRTLFNNDFDNSSGMGVGNDFEYYETNQGKLVDARKDGKPITARFVRVGSKEGTGDVGNRFTEVEVWGRAVKNGK